MSDNNNNRVNKLSFYMLW